MPTLTWIGKEAVVNHHRKVPFHLLEEVPELSFGDQDSGNLLVEGDNLLALKALLPYYAGKVKCIYIDPPYNTGNENWVYNDNVSSPEIKNWLGTVVGREAEDLTRHDKWLCMMYPRLRMLWDFLRDDGILLVSIDDGEVSRLRLLLDEIWGTRNWMGTLIWKRRLTPDSRNLNGVSSDHEYVLAYGKTSAARFRGQDKDLSKYKNPDNDPRGAWMSDNLTGLANPNERPNLHYDVVHPTTAKHYPPHPSRGWIYGQERMASLISEGRILWPRSPKGRPRLKRFLTDMKQATTGFSTVLDAPANVAGTKELSGLLGPKVFAFPKPSGLIQILLRQATDGDSIVLDSFAGSGTTGQAVARLNAEDGGSRRFVLVEVESKVSREVTSKRLGAVVGSADSSLVGGSGIRYCRINRPLFDEKGHIRSDIAPEELGSLVYFAETGTPLKRRECGQSLLDVHQGVAVYLLDVDGGGGAVLNSNVLRKLSPHDGPKVIYGTACRVSPVKLREQNIVFKQIPYDIKV